MTVNSAPVVIIASRNQARRRITGWFMSQHAVSARDAIPYTPAKLNEQRQFDRMLARGVLKRGVGNTYWLDTVAYAADRHSRQARVGLIAGTLAAIIAIILMLSYQR